MPYILKKYNIIEGEKIENFLVEVVKLSPSLSQKLLVKGRVIDHKNRRLQKGQVLKEGFIELSIFKAESKGLKPLFETEHFAIFDKPSGVMVHPTTRSIKYTLLDEIKHYLGEEASLVHRIDAETSGLVLVSKNPYSNMVFSQMFEDKLFVKKYKALVEGNIKNEILIDSKIGKSTGLIKLKMEISEDGKKSSTLIKPICFDKEKQQTLVEAIPYTGRQHQIRVHLASLGYRILGDPIYGIDAKDSNNILNRKTTKEERINISGAARLMLHAYYLEFTFLKRTYKLTSKYKFP